MRSTGVDVVPYRAFAVRGQDGLRRIIEKLLVLHPLSRAQRTRNRFLLTHLGIRIDRSSLAEIKDLSLDQIRARVFQETIQLISDCIKTTIVFVIDDCDRADEQLKDFVRRLGEG
jgi:predicted ATPase